MRSEESTHRARFGHICSMSKDFPIAVGVARHRDGDPACTGAEAMPDSRPMNPRCAHVEGITAARMAAGMTSRARRPLLPP